MTVHKSHLEIIKYSLTEFSVKTTVIFIMKHQLQKYHKYLKNHPYVSKE